MIQGPRTTSDPSFCRACLEKQRKIDALLEENQRLKDRLRWQERTAREETFGSSTPSARRLVKSSSPPEPRARRGGAVPGRWTWPFLRVRGRGGHGRDAGRAGDLSRLRVRAGGLGRAGHIPADNNRAERELRPLVIARRISFGSQSDRGLRTRESLMTMLNTLAKRTDDFVGVLTRTLDALADNPDLNIADYLFGPSGIAPVPKVPTPDSDEPLRTGRPHQIGPNSCCLA